MSMLLRRNRHLAEESKKMNAPEEVKEEKREVEKPCAKSSPKAQKKKA